MRIYQSTLLEDFASRGGKVVIGQIEPNDVARLSEHHDLMVVASGRRSLSEMFPRDPHRSPYTQPQRLLTGAFCHGIEFPDPLGVVYTIAPGQGEIFLAPFTSFSGPVVSLLFEGIPGQAFDNLTHTRYDDDPKRFESTMLDLVREHAPLIYERVNPKEFGVTRPLDVLQGSITPVVRSGYAALPNGKFAMAVGDIHMLVDPVLAQGANTAARCGWLLGEALLQDCAADEHFCRTTEQLLWQAGRAPVQWTNMMLQPPPSYAVELFATAMNNKALADELIDNFNEPDRNWEIFSSPEGAAAFLGRHAMVAI
jgi:hypothetical protein